MKRLHTIFIFLALASISLAQSEQMRFQFDGGWTSIASSIRHAGDGFVLAGSIGNNNNATFGDMVVIRTDSNLSPLWNKQFKSYYSSGSNGFPCAKQAHLEYASDIVAVADGYIMVGTHDNRDGAFCNGPNTHLLGEFDIVVAKLDLTGNPVWINRYGNGQTQMATSVTATRDGGFLISGFSNVQVAVLSAPLPFFMKIDAQGDVVWSKRQSNFAFQGLSALFAAGSWRFPIIELQNGGFAYAASTGNNTFIVRLDSMGDLRWAKNFYHGDATGHLNQSPDWGVGAASFAYFHSLLEHPNGNLSLVGNLYFTLAVIVDPEDPFGASFILGGHLELDGQGSYVRSSIFGHPTGHRDVIYDLASSDAGLLPNGNLLIGGYNESYAFMLEYDQDAGQANTHSQWARQFRTYNYSAAPFGYDLPSLVVQNGKAHIFYDDFKIGSVSLPAGNSGCMRNWSPIQSISLDPITLPDVSANMNFNTSIGLRGSLSLIADTLRNFQVEDLCQTSSVQPAHLTENNLNIYPNPATSDHLNVQLPIAEAGVYTVSILDLHGKKQYSKSMLLNQGEVNIQLEATLKSGLHIAVVEGAGRRWTGKLIR